MTEVNANLEASPTAELRGFGYITVVAQNGTASYTPTIRSRFNTTTSIVSDDDETLLAGVTPATLRAEITQGTDGLLYKRVVAAGGTETWVVA